MTNMRLLTVMGSIPTRAMEYFNFLSVETRQSAALSFAPRHAMPSTRHAKLNSTISKSTVQGNIVTIILINIDIKFHLKHFAHSANSTWWYRCSSLATFQERSSWWYQNLYETRLLIFMLVVNIKFQFKKNNIKQLSKY